MPQNTRTTARPNASQKSNNEKGSGKKEHIRKKAWKPKTKTGCVTCRIRRVKCDEAKPSCQRCTSTGRKCDGYTTPAPVPQSYAIVYAPPQLPLAFVPGLDLNSTAEQDAFHFFKHHTASELSGFFDSSFWQFEVLQASHSLPAIRHAIVAMAAMHRKFMVGRMPVVPDDPSDRQINFALQQWVRASQELRQPSTKRNISDIMDMMTACILFYCLACFQGHQSVALEQLRSGLKFLRDVDEQLAAGTGTFGQHPISLETLRTMFVMMDVQARGVMGDERLRTWERQPKRAFAEAPSSFKTFTQARAYFEGIFNDMLAFMQGIDINPPTDPDATGWVIARYHHFQRQFDETSVLLEQFLGQLSHITSQEDRESILGIKLFREQVRVYLRVFKGFNGEKGIREINWHVEENDMSIIVDLASELLGAPPDLTIPPGAVPQDYYPSPADLEHVSRLEIPSYSRPVFSSASGLLSALWLVCARAQSSALRRNAIALMLEFPRREGVWDGVVAGRVAWESLILEEIAFDGELGARKGRLEPRSEYIPESNRVRAVKLKYVAPRVMEVEFRSLKQFEMQQRGVTRLLAW